LQFINNGKKQINRQTEKPRKKKKKTTMEEAIRYFKPPPRIMISPCEYKGLDNDK